MDLGILAGILLLVIWGIGMLFLGAPGWMNLFLTVGVTMLIWRVVTRGTPRPEKPGDAK